MNEDFVEVQGLTKRYGERIVVHDVTFALAAGSFLSLLGPSGSGKTTILRMLAGLVTPDGGTMAIDGQTVYSATRQVPVEERGLGMVFQDYALWPHMTVGQNIAFGLRLRRLSRDATRSRVSEMLTLVGLVGLEQRFPYQLSGGQQQRVAMARALAIRPKLLLLDEPLSSLDAGLREAMREELVDIVRAAQMTVINVTHDQNEAMVMSDQVLLLRDGQVQQFGTPAALYERPRTAFIGRFMGAANVVIGTLVERAGAQVTIQQGPTILRGRAAQIVSGEVGTVVTLLCRPEAVRIATTPPADATNTLDGVVTRAAFADGRWRLTVQTSLVEGVLAASDREIPRDTAVWVTLAPEQCFQVEGEQED